MHIINYEELKKSKSEEVLSNARWGIAQADIMVTYEFS